MRYPMQMKCVVGVLLLAILGCGAKKGPEPKPTSDLRLEPLPHEEAELIALWLSDEIEAPMVLYERVRDDLLAIRTVYKDIPELDSIAFLAPWGIGHLGFEYSAGGLDWLLAGESAVWDSLNDRYQPEFDSSFTNAVFPGRLHPRLLGEAYGAIAEIEFIGTGIPICPGGCSYQVSPVVQSASDLGYAFHRAYRTMWPDDPHQWSFWCFYSTPSGISYAGQYSFDSAHVGEDQPYWWLDFCPSVRGINALPDDWCSPVWHDSRTQITQLDRSYLRYDLFDELRELAIDGDTLRVTIGTGGGCRQHDLALFMTPASFMESSPAQADLIIVHEGNDDPCLAFISVAGRFDISPIADLYEQFYGRRDDIVLRIWDYDQEEFDTITYSPK